jgi:hypothetical protein
MNLQKRSKELMADKAEIEARLERTSKHLYHKDQPVSANFHEQLIETGNDVLVQTLEQEGRAELKLINKALERLVTGEYQRCSRCGQTISEQRLEAIPYTDVCIKCA